MLILNRKIKVWVLLSWISPGHDENVINRYNLTVFTGMHKPQNMSPAKFDVRLILI